MNSLSRLALLPVAVLTTAATLVIAVDSASAQIPPPFLVGGSIVDAEGDIPAGVPVLAYIGDVECTNGKHVTEKTGDGDAEITAYAVDLYQAGQREGCAVPGSVVRIKIGDRFAPGSVTIGDDIIYRFDAVFGNATPAAIPTFTPTPQVTPEPGGTNNTPGTDDETPEGAGTPDPSASATATNENGEAIAANPGSPDDSGGSDSEDARATDASDDDGGMPGWAIFAGVAAAAIVVVGGIGSYMKFGRNGS